MKFCPDCSAPVELRQPANDNRMRHICVTCATIHYQNPKLVIGTIPEWEDGRILLCRRAIEPRYGLWTLPAGFMENGETTAEAAIRETMEEATAHVALGELYSMYNLPYINQVHLLFRAKLLDLDFSPGVESLQVELFEEQDVPWDKLSFRPIFLTLQHYFADRKIDNFKFRIGDLNDPSRYT